MAHAGDDDADAQRRAGSWVVDGNVQGMPYSLGSFRFTDMMDCRARVRNLFDDAPPATVSEAAERVVQFFYSELLDADGGPACALARFFRTVPYRDLDEETRAFARSAAGDEALAPHVRCLTLMATTGREAEWKSRRTSRGHRAIPLTTVEVVERAPMIAQLISQMGLNIATVVRPPAGLMLDDSGTKHNVFYVPRAEGSPHIVAQNEFVIPHGIASVLGFGGIVASGDMFATILFSRVPISAEAADLFSVIGLNLKIAILPFMSKPLFEP